MSLTLLLASLVIPVAVLLVDYGRRRLTTWRIVRPFLATAIVMPFVMPGLDLAGRGLLLEGAGIGAGVLLGLLAGAAMRVERDPGTTMLMTVAGLPYLAIWVVVALARLLFAYGAQHSAAFARALGSFLAANHKTASSLADAIVFLGFAMLVVQRGTLVARSYLSAWTPARPDQSRTSAAIGSR